MAWAIWRYQHGRECALKLHVKFNLLEEKPVGAVLKNARCCERSVAREQMKAGEFYVGDRYYGEDYALFGELEAAGCSYVLRLRQEAVFEVVEQYELSAEERAAGVTFDGLVRLGARPKHPPLRLVRVQTEASELLLVTDKPRGELCAELIALIYRYRRGGGGDKRGLADGRAGASSSFSNGSSASPFDFAQGLRLGCRHWLAESERGVALPIRQAQGLAAHSAGSGPSGPFGRLRA